uniref:Uncharacterized protein n=1 Tax=Parastrongyloides trichosuri TaxID=131310 RepID=A0A0N5A6T6_PARTI
MQNILRINIEKYLVMNGNKPRRILLQQPMLQEK